MGEKTDSILRLDITRLLEDDSYIPDEYTETVKSILSGSNKTFTVKQRKALVTHLKVYYEKLLK